MCTNCLWRSIDFATLALLLSLLAVRPLGGAVSADQDATDSDPAIVRAEFLYEKADFPSCHASTLAFCDTQLVAAWFGGTDEGSADVGIWLSRCEASAWTRPTEVANGIQPDGRRFPCWNPVLVKIDQGPLILFYKVGPKPSTWWGMMIQSTDAGRTWSQPVRLPDDIAGPIKNKPLMLQDGRLLCGSSTEDQGWRVHMEWTSDQGKTWQRSEPLNDGKTLGAIQPTILRHSGERLQILCRSRGVGKILQAWSDDLGKSWSALEPIALPNPNSGIDAVTLHDGRQVLVYNHTRHSRSPLNVAISPDGQRWFTAASLETRPGEYSYPAIVQGPDGLVHITYTWQRRQIRHVVLDVDKFPQQEIIDGVWPE